MARLEIRMTQIFLLFFHNSFFFVYRHSELVSKAKIELLLFQQYFTPHIPPLKQGESETTLSPDLPSTRIIRSKIPFRECFKSCSSMSDLVTRYGPQAKARFTCLVLVPFEHEPSKSECW